MSVSYEEYRKQWLAGVVEGSPSTLELGRRFAQKLLTQWLDVEPDSDDLILCDGSGDGGIDIAYLQRSDRGEADEDESEQGDTWYLVQSKYGSAFRGDRTLLEEGLKIIDTIDGRRHKLSSLAEGVRDRLHFFRQKVNSLNRIIVIFATTEPLTDEQKQRLIDLRAMGQARIGILFDVDSISIRTIYDRIQEGAQKITRFHLIAKVNASGDHLLVGSVSLVDLYTFLKNYRDTTNDLDQLYEKNIRKFLGSRGKINKSMRETLTKAPQQFGLYNNGITIVVKDFKRNGDGKPDDYIELTDPYIVNGCQTTRTIWEVFRPRFESGGHGKDPELETWSREAQAGVVITKIVRVRPEDEGLLEKITRYTNTQNAVREKDFLALRSDINTWARLMGEKYNIYLETQRGGWDSRRALQNQNPGLTQYKHSANAFDLLKVFGAGWLGEAGTAYGRNEPFLANGSIFKRITDNGESEEPFGVDDLYAAYQLKAETDHIGFGRGSNIKETRRQSRFLFYMTVIELLKDIMIRLNQATTPRDITKAVIKLFASGAEDGRRALLDAAIEVVDEYMTPGTEDSIFQEPKLIQVFNGDIGGYLKWERLGKTEEDSHHYRDLITMTRRTLGRGNPPPRDLVATALKKS